MAGRSPALLAFAQKDPKEDHRDSMYKYLVDVGLEPDEVKNWGRIGSLVEVLKADYPEPCRGCTLGQEFIDFVAKLPTGNTPRPHIRHQLQRTPPV
jgi:hypothetical protein